MKEARLTRSVNIRLIPAGSSTSRSGRSDAALRAWLGQTGEILLPGQLPVVLCSSLFTIDCLLLFVAKIAMAVLTTWALCGVFCGIGKFFTWPKIEKNSRGGAKKREVVLSLGVEPRISTLLVWRLTNLAIKAVFVRTGGGSRRAVRVVAGHVMGVGVQAALQGTAGHWEGHDGMVYRQFVFIANVLLIFLCFVYTELFMFVWVGLLHTEKCASSNIEYNC